MPLLNHAANSESIRNERKFLVPDNYNVDLEFVVKLNNGLFREIYYERYVNNIYFDTIGLHNFWDNVDGSENRLKVRLRWYGDLEGLNEFPKLELKNRSGLAGWKNTYNIKPFDLATLLQEKGYFQAIRPSVFPPQLANSLKLLRPTLVNRYKRKYFISADGIYRITIDKEMEYMEPTMGAAVHFRRKVTDRSTILELKYSCEHDNNANKIPFQFPFRLTKSSKYVIGLAMLNGISF